MAPSRRLAACLVIWQTVVLAACGGGDSSGGGARAAAGDPARDSRGAWSLKYNLTGGADGFDVTFEVGSDGHARYRRRVPRPMQVEGQLPRGRVSDLADRVRESGFLGLSGTYAPEVRIAGAFTYRIEWIEGETRVRVEATDGAPLPDAFVQVRDLVGDLQRALLRPEGSRTP